MRRRDIILRGAIRESGSYRRKKRYTVRELDELRSAVERRWLYGTSLMPEGVGIASRSYDEVEKVRCVEEIVRTHIQAGHTADDLQRADLEIYDRHNQITRS